MTTRCYPKNTPWPWHFCRSAGSRFYVCEMYITRWPPSTSLPGVSLDVCSFLNVPWALPHSYNCSRLSLSLECSTALPGSLSKCLPFPHHLFSSTACSGVISWLPPLAGSLPPRRPQSTARSSLLVLTLPLPSPRPGRPCAIVVPLPYQLLRSGSFCPT